MFRHYAFWIRSVCLTEVFSTEPVERTLTDCAQYTELHCATLRWIGTPCAAWRCTVHGGSANCKHGHWKHTCRKCLKETVATSTEPDELWKVAKKLGGTPACRALKRAMATGKAVIGPNFGFARFLASSSKLIEKREWGDYVLFDHSEHGIQVVNLATEGQILRPADP